MIHHPSARAARVIDSTMDDSRGMGWPLVVFGRGGASSLIAGDTPAATLSCSRRGSTPNEGHDIVVDCRGYSPLAAWRSMRLIAGFSLTTKRVRSPLCICKIHMVAF